MAGWTGLEPATFCVTGRRSNQLSYHPEMGRTVIFPGTSAAVKREFQCHFHPSKGKSWGAPFGNTITVVVHPTVKQG
jgi:hypothetical protein